jgi:hypothetical protein
MENSNQETIVQSNVVAEENTLSVRFVPNVSNNAKAPVYRALLALPGALSGIVTEIPIFRAKDGVSYDVMMPGGRFPSMRPANLIVDGADGRKWETTVPVIEGKRKADQLPALIKTAFGAYLATGTVEHEISFS